MLCISPIHVHGQEVGCGQCGPCRTNFVRLRTAQLILEHRLALRSVMVTATYDEQHCPTTRHPEIDSRLSALEENVRRDHSNGRPVCPETPSVLKTHLRQIGNALRRHGYSRHYGVSEYGEKTGRPHYHFLVFQADPLVLKSSLEADGWSYGYIHTKPVEKSAQMAYIAGYVSKKQREKTYLPGQQPEAALHPIGPALGRPMVESTARWLSHQFWMEDKDVPRFFMYQGKYWPYSYPQRQRMRKIMGRPLRDSDQEGLVPLHPKPGEVVDLDARWRTWETFQRRKNIYGSQTQRL